jgi:hypothetical protein
MKVWGSFWSYCRSVFLVRLNGVRFSRSNFSKEKSRTFVGANNLRGEVEFVNGLRKADYLWWGSIGVICLELSYPRNEYRVCKRGQLTYAVCLWLRLYFQRFSTCLLLLQKVRAHAIHCSLVPHSNRQSVCRFDVAVQYLILSVVSVSGLIS